MIQAVGFKRDRNPGSAEFYYQLKWPKGKVPNEKMMSNNGGEDTTTISPALENALRILRGYRSEVETELKHLNGGMASVSDGISKLYNKSQSWENVTDALNLSLQYVSNILKNPDDADVGEYAM